MSVGRPRPHLWFRAITAAVLSATTAAVVVLAVTATGNPVTHALANDGGVWLVDDSPGSGFNATFGEFNVPITQLGSHFAAPGKSFSSDLNVLQSGTTVLAVDRSRHVVYPVDEQTGSVEASNGVKYPAKGVVAMGGAVVAILEPADGAKPGRVWAAPTGGGVTASLARLDISKKPTATLSGATALAVDSAGDVYLASRNAIEEVPRVASGLGHPKTTRFSSALSSVALTTVGTTPVVLDATHRTIVLPGSGVTATLPAGKGAPVLQQSGGPAATVLVANGTELLSEPLVGGAPTLLGTVPNGGGAPAQPVALDGCAYGAWGGSPVYRARVCTAGGQHGPVVATALKTSGGRTATSVRPVFRVNNNFIILNDPANGSAWLVAGAPSQVLAKPAWLRVLEGDRLAKSKTKKNFTTTKQQQGAPTLHNPLLYARVGQQSVLHVLDDDAAPSGGMLAITAISPASGPGYTLAISPDTQKVILTLHPGSPSSITFDYTVADASGMTASGPVTVDATTSETPPQQLPGTSPTLHVESGSSVSFQVLGGWRDKQSDPIYLSDASVTRGQVTWTSDGLVDFTAPSSTSDVPVTLTYDVTDGRSPPVKATEQLDVAGSGDPHGYPPTGVADAAKVLVGQPAVISPLANDIFGADPANPGAKLALAGPVSPVANLTVATNTDTGDLTVTASRPGIYALSYQATFGSLSSAPTEILVQAAAPAATPQSPVTTPISVLLHGQLPTTVNVLASDYDPAGGLLTVVSVHAPPGLQATIEKGQFVRIVGTGGGGTKGLTVTYQVSDGTTNPSSGQIAVAEEPPLPPTPPVVPDTYATVRAGDAVNVPVLASATDPDGEPISLLTGGVKGPVQLARTGSASTTYRTGLGAASVSGGYLRYSAPSGLGMTAPETVTASFVVAAAGGSATTGHTFLTIVPDAASENTQPQPTEVDARVSAGGTVTIPIPTTGVDPDGDSVTVTGIASPPSLGRVVSVSPTRITYQAFPLSSTSGQFDGGTDTFSYVVTAPTGQTGVAQVRVGVTPPTQAQAPVAVEHFVTGAPGATVEVPLLAGDVVPAGEQVTVLPLAKTNSSLPAGASLVGKAHNVLQVRAPRGATPVEVAYGITNGTGSPSIAHVVVRDQPNYSIAPVAADYFPSLPSRSAKTILVDVLAKDSDPSGAGHTLKLVGSPARGVKVSGSKLAIPVETNPRVVPYVVKSTSSGDTATGVVHVPGTGDGLHLVGGKTIQVPAGGSTTVSIGDYITDPGHPVRITTTSRVVAAPGFGLTGRVTSNTSVDLTAGKGYQGPGSLTVQVADAANLSSHGVQTRTFSIPVQVGQPSPIVRCPSTPLTVVEGGAAITPAIATLCTVWTPSGSGPSSVSFTAKWAHQAPGVSLGWAPGGTGKVLDLSAGSAAAPGATGQITIGVPKGSAEDSSTLTVQVGAAPLPTTAPVTVPGVETGHSVTVDMAQYVTSPLAKPQIVVVGVTGPNQGKATVSHSGSTVTITPHTGSHGTESFSVQVSDAGPARHDRTVTDTITLQVLDVPSAPTGLQGVPGNHQVALSWTAATPNGAPVTSYVVTMNGGATKQAMGTALTWTGLTNGSSYSFTVTAINQVGKSAVSTPVSAAPRSVPAAPASVTATGGNQQASLSWSAPNDNGQPIVSYAVSISPAVGGPSTATVPGTTTSYTWKGLSNAVGPYSFTVTARNSVGVGPVSSPSNKVYAHGTPPAPSAPSATGAVSPDQTTTTITVTWPAISQCNDAQPCASYVVKELKNGATVVTDPTTGTCGSSGSGCSASFGPLTNDGSAYSYELEAVNEEGQTSPASGASNVVYAVGNPSAVTDLSASPGTRTITLTFTLPASHGSSLSRVRYTASSGSGTVSGTWTNPGASGQTYTNTISGLTNGTTYVVWVVVYNERTAPSPTSNKVNADPYGPPQPPVVSATASGNTITYSWSGGGNNGRPVTNYHYCITNTGCHTASAPGSTSVAYACATTGTITATVTDSAGQTSGTSQMSARTATCPPPPSPTVTISWGGSAPPTYCSGTATCAYINISVSNFAPGRYEVYMYSTHTGQWYPYAGATPVYITANSSGTGSLQDDFWYGFGGDHYKVYSVINGVRSNTITH